MRKLTIAAAIAVIASLAFTGVASAHTLRYKTARSLAVRLAEQEEREDPVDRWRIFGAERIKSEAGMSLRRVTSALRTKKKRGSSVAGPTVPPRTWKARGSGT